MDFDRAKLLIVDKDCMAYGVTRCDQVQTQIPFGDDEQNLCRYEALRDDALPPVIVPFF